VKTLPVSEGNLFSFHDGGPARWFKSNLFAYPAPGKLAIIILRNSHCWLSEKEDLEMKTLATLGAVLIAAGSLGAGLAGAADDSKVKQGAKEVESGGKQVGQGVADTAKGVGKTVVGGAEVAGEKIKEAGEAAKPKAKNAWENVRDGSVNFGQSVKTFFTRLFDNSPKSEEVKERPGTAKPGDSTQR
jgi:hypothetical protein